MISTIDFGSIEAGNVKLDRELVNLLSKLLDFIAFVETNFEILKFLTFFGLYIERNFEKLIEILCNLGHV